MDVFSLLWRRGGVRVIALCKAEVSTGEGDGWSSAGNANQKDDFHTFQKIRHSPELAFIGLAYTDEYEPSQLHDKSPWLQSEHFFFAAPEDSPRLQY